MHWHCLRQRIAQPAKRSDSGKAEKNAKSPPSAARKHGSLRQSEVPPATLGVFRQAEHNTDSSPGSSGAEVVAEQGIGDYGGDYGMITVTLYHLHHFQKHNRRACLLHPLNYDNAQRVRQPDAKLRPALRVRPQFAAGCG